MPPETNHLPTDEERRRYRAEGAFTHALVGAQRALDILSKGHESARSDRQRLAKAAEALSAYLAELER